MYATVLARVLACEKLGAAFLRLEHVACTHSERNQQHSQSEPIPMHLHPVAPPEGADEEHRGGLPHGKGPCRTTGSTRTISLDPSALLGGATRGKRRGRTGGTAKKTLYSTCERVFSPML